jgi:hypothetical protein
LNFAVFEPPVGLSHLKIDAFENISISWNVTWAQTLLFWYDK